MGRVMRVARVTSMSDFFQDCIIETAYMQTGLNVGLGPRDDNHHSYSLDKRKETVHTILHPQSIAMDTTTYQSTSIRS